MKLSDATLRKVKPKDTPQKLADGGGLFLFVSPGGSKHWRMSYRFNGKEKVLSFGPYPLVTLREAREKRDEAKKLLLNGVDPMAQKQEAKAIAVAAAKDERETFSFVAQEWFETYHTRLSPKHAKKLKDWLEKRLFPELGDIPVTKIEPQHLLDAVRPAERRGHIETAHKLMQLCGQVMRHAKITGRVKYDVASGLSEAMQKPKHKNFAAITEPKKIGQLLRDIDEYHEGYFAIRYCLKILPYVFTRPSELRLAEWKEFDFENALWKIPAARMKMRREHAVPLAAQVLSLFRELKRYSGGGDFLFPSIRTKTDVISDAGPLAALRRLGYDQEQMTLHGFRAMASTNLNELGFRADVIEAQLAHKEPDSVRLAYNRAQYMDERRKMMQSYADYLDELRATL